MTMSFGVPCGWCWGSIWCEVAMSHLVLVWLELELYPHSQQEVEHFLSGCWAPTGLLSLVTDSVCDLLGQHLKAQLGGGSGLGTSGLLLCFLQRCFC